MRLISNYNIINKCIFCKKKKIERNNPAYTSMCADNRLYLFILYKGTITDSVCLHYI